MDNKGQSLVAFILLLPAMFLLLTGVWEIGNLSYINNKIEEEMISSLKYGLKHIEEDNIKDKVKSLLDKNLDGTKEVIVEGNEIIIKVNYKYINLYSKYIKPIEISKSFIGKKENDNLIIEKEG